MTWWLGLLVGLAIGIPTGAALMAVWFLRLTARLDSIDMATTIGVLRDKLRKQGGFFIGWQIGAALVALLAVGAFVGFSRYQVNACRAELAEFRRAYDVLSVQVQTQAAAMSELERKAKEAASRGAQARTEAKPVVAAAQKSADALAGAMRGLRPVECPTKDAVRVVRDDLGNLR